MMSFAIGLISIAVGVITGLYLSDHFPLLVSALGGGGAALLFFFTGELVLGDDVDW